MRVAAAIPDPFHPPVKRSITIAGHETSISLEPVFWYALAAAAAAQALPVNALVARIDAQRIDAAALPNLASALRSWLLHDAMVRTSPISADSANDVK